MIEDEMAAAQHLREILESIPGIDQVTVDEYRGTLTARVIASRYEGVDEVDRQAEIYRVLLREMPGYERRLVEFVFTDTPQEYAEMLAGSGDAAEA